jgi:GNAT superfamily N-acetyltransferase
MDVVVRKGRAEDLPAALALIKELAVYEKAQDEVEVDLLQMEGWAFGDKRIFEFFVLTVDGIVKGLALYYYKYSTWKGRCLFLEDLIVTEPMRQRGYGSLLFKEVIRVAKTEKVKRLEWQVLDWNTPAIEFYKRFNSKLDPEWVNCKLTHDQLELL